MEVKNIKVSELIPFLIRVQNFINGYGMDFVEKAKEVLRANQEYTPLKSLLA